MANWGLGLIATLQQHGNPALDVLFRLASTLSEGEAPLLFVALVYWSLGTRAALRLLLLLLASTLLNQALKEIFRLPRPFAFDASLQRYPAEGYGLPSGHAQTAVVQWGTLAHYLARRPAWLLAALLIFLVGLSRVYLGVHFPMDVVAGWLVGGLLLALAMIRWPWSPPAWHGEAPGPRRVCLARLLTGAAGFLLLYLLVASLFPGRVSLHYLTLALWSLAGAPWVFRRAGWAGASAKAKT